MFSSAVTSLHFSLPGVLVIYSDIPFLNIGIMSIGYSFPNSSVLIKIRLGLLDIPSNIPSNIPTIILPNGLLRFEFLGDIFASFGNLKALGKRFNSEPNDVRPVVCFEFFE